jgi:tripartite-type tricarboxylate transporter receptor subunit TctC
MQDLMGGTIQMAVGTLGGMLPLHRSGKMRIVGVATAQRSPMAPDIPTIAESAGLPAPFEAMLWNAVAVPLKTPPTVMKTLADASARAMAEPQLLATLAEQGMFADLRIGDVAASAYVKSEAQRWKPVVANLDLKKQ